MADHEITTAEAVIDNGTFGTRTIRFETGRLARQAAGSAVAYLDDDTMMLSATTASQEPEGPARLLPADGRRRGADVRRRAASPARSSAARAGPSEDAILTCRLIDRPLRPSLRQGPAQRDPGRRAPSWRSTPTTSTTSSRSTRPSMSTQLAGLPFSGPIGAIRVALIDGQWVAFPTHAELERATFDMVVAGRVLDGRRRRDHDGRGRGHRRTRSSSSRGGAHRADRGGRRRRASRPPSRSSQTLCEAQAELAAGAAKPTGEFPRLPRLPGRRARGRRGRGQRPSSPQALTIAGKQEREAELDRVKALAAETARRRSSRVARRRSARAFRSLTKKLVRQRVLRDKVRIDGRGLTDIRPLSAEVEVLPRVHGSALFERGETQILGVTTLNMLRMEQQLDTLAPGDAQALHAQLQLPAVLHR